MTFYNEIDPRAAAWIGNLIGAGHVSPGIVDKRSIRDVAADDVRPFRRCHFFAGIAGWDYALRLAGWPDDRPVWTGSCPCQPYSAAGKGQGDDDPRNLWPEFFRLIRERRPDTIFGEQVESAIGYGWLDGISRDMEGEGYAIGAVVLGAHSVGSPHIRQRLYWVADTGRRGCGPWEGHDSQGQRIAEFSFDDDRFPCRMGDSQGERFQSSVAVEPRHAGWIEQGGRSQVSGNPGHWSDFDLIPCLDGKARRVESGSFPLAHGVPGRVGLLRGYGNAIVPQVAAEFIAAFMECESA